MKRILHEPFIKNLNTFFLMKLMITGCLSILAFHCFSQPILSVSGEYANILTPCTEKLPGTQIPCNINSKKWKDYSKTKTLKNVNGEYSVFSFDGLVGKAKVTSIDTSDDNGPYCGPVITLSRKFDLTNKLYAVKSTWNVLPRPSKILSGANPAYEDAIKVILQQKAELKNSKVIIKKIIKVDLDGDKKDEVIIHATNHLDIYNAVKGDYSLVIIRHIVNEKVVTDVLNFEYRATNCESKDGGSCMLTQYSISAILDLDGDGHMELIITDEEHESAGVTVFEMTPEGIKSVIGWGCGV